jgi:hypothetical protein
VRAHDRVALLAGGTVPDGTVTGTNEHVAVENVDRSDEIVEFDLNSSNWKAFTRAVPLNDAAVLATGEELASVKLESTDHALGVTLKTSDAGSVVGLPDIDIVLGGSTVGSALVVPGSASERSLWVSGVDTLSLVEGRLCSVPEVEVLNTGSGEAITVGVEAHVVDLLTTSLFLAKLTEFGSSSGEDVNAMVVVSIDASDLGAVLVERAGSDSSGSLRELGAAFLLSSGGVPGEQNWLGSVLTGDSGVTSVVDLATEDIVSVSGEIASRHLGFLSDLATAEELLGVVSVVEDDTESGGHVDGVALAVEVAVLLGIGTSVSVDVLELVLLVWLSGVNVVVVGWLSNLALPWDTGGCLFANGLVALEEVVVVDVSVLGSSFVHVGAEFAGTGS